MTLTLTTDTLRSRAAEIIVDHATDVERLSISERLEELELPADDHDTACESIGALIKDATVTVSWADETPGIPNDLLLQLLAQANADDGLDVAEDELLTHRRTATFAAVIEVAYAAGVAASTAPEPGERNAPATEPWQEAYDMDADARTLQQIRDAVAHHCTSFCDEGGCDFVPADALDVVRAALTERSRGA